MINQILIITIAYLIGSLSFGIIVSKLLNLSDPRTIGSKNTGATNVMRTGNKLAAILTLLGDIFKATIVVKISFFFGLNDLEMMQVCLAILIGHTYPIYYKFKGGKGVATALGILLAINWILALSIIFIWIGIFSIWRYSSLAAIIAALSLPIISYFLNEISYIFITYILITALIIFNHRGNIRNLIKGIEPSFKK
ncbi:glycerol-3-phosphate 1-O-acyltransferase PlsY [Methylophilaceae bacterium]|nr:glycerol-3-phosphate 1-O-acyltransferase PlsY [Methylophilaceae bacterium]|tara:strand:+ start:1440 stop:2027 length:588 start_codon:yes stop_codon:yes gene_type:complete